MTFINYTLYFQIKKTKVATKGAKQIVEENKTTLNFYQNMIIGAVGIYFMITMLFFNFTTLATVSFIFEILFLSL